MGFFNRTGSGPGGLGLQPDHDLLVRMDEKLNTVVKQSGDHEARLKVLEHRTDNASGALSGIRAVWVVLALIVVVAPNFLNVILSH